MTGTNHMLAGGIIGAAVASPLVIPLAFASHFVLDALPHYGIDEHKKRAEDTVWKIDAALIIALMGYISFVSFDAKAWALAGALVAASPDLAWVYRFSVNEHFGKKTPKDNKNRFNQFHANIQKRESTELLWVEVVSMIVLSGLFIGIVGS